MQKHDLYPLLFHTHEPPERSSLTWMSLPDLVDTLFPARWIPTKSCWRREYKHWCRRSSEGIKSVTLTETHSVLERERERERLNALNLDSLSRAERALNSKQASSARRCAAAELQLEVLVMQWFSCLHRMCLNVEDKTLN